ncbi:transcription factor HES-7.1-like [Spea bombifrons]|uniref:transcription factor HES-7.1-like n=1 Tax=Spea bombifrons TaxID=233779 RepID=UPI00234BAABF|nr:transcription factor HES-7.1-like [Spea bombifrons]
MKVASESRHCEPKKRLLKPMVEKQRRERINKNLEAIRVLLSGAMGHEKLRNPKIEKAELLEYTVQFLQTSRLASGGGQQEAKSCYHFGHNHCLQTAINFIKSNKELHHAIQVLLSQQLSLIGRTVESSAPRIRDHSFSHLQPLMATFAEKEMTHNSCSNNVSLDHTNTFVATQGHILSTNQTGMCWRPWV